MNRKIIALTVLGLVLFACLLACGFFGVKAIRRTRLRHAAMTAYENKEYALAERLLHAYIQQDPNAEAEYVALANIYHELGNAGMEAQMWQSASSMNPLKTEYHENMLSSAAHATCYSLLYSVLGRKKQSGESLTDRELYLYVISSIRTGYQKNGTDAYQEAVKEDPEAFHKNELGRLAEFMVKYSGLSEGERTNYLNKAMESDDPVVRFDAIYTVLSRMARINPKSEEDGIRMEDLLKQAVATNYYAGTPLLADYYFSKYRFGDVLTVIEPYLKTIDDADQYLLYAESCVFDGKLDELKELEKKLRRKPGLLPLMADYCRILIASMEDNKNELAENVRKSGLLVSSPLSRVIRLRVALDQDLYNEILAVAGEIFSNPPFHDLHERASFLCLDYLVEQMEKPENQDDPSRMAALAKVLAGYLQENRLLTDIILADQYQKGLASGSDLLNALERFPNDLLLLELASEHLIFNGKAEQALELIEQAKSNDADDRKLDFLHMLALDQLERYNEAEVLFRDVVEHMGFDIHLLSEYFRFCRENKRRADLMAMASKLENAADDSLKPFADFFRAAALLLEDDEAKTQEALDLLAATPNDHPEFTFYAANRLCDNDRLDEAEAKYKAILKTYQIPPLILVNLSELYHSKGEEQKALDAAKEAFELEKGSMLPAFIYAKRLSEANRFEDAVNALNFPRHAVDFREDIVDLWCSCMRHVIEKNMSDERFSQAEDHCRHLLDIAPDDEFGKETMEKVREILSPKKDDAKAEGAEDVHAA